MNTINDTNINYEDLFWEYFLEEDNFKKLIYFTKQEIINANEFNDFLVIGLFIKKEKHL